MLLHVCGQEAARIASRFQEDIRDNAVVGKLIHEDVPENSGTGLLEIMGPL